MIGLYTIYFGFTRLLCGDLISGSVPLSWLRGIINGALICVAGVLSAVSSKNSKNQCKIRWHMLFSIVACCGWATGIILFSIILG